MIRTLESLTDRMLSAVVPAAEAQAMAPQCKPVFSENVTCGGYPFPVKTVTTSICIDFDARTFYIQKSGGC
ncbi:hypothetical protein [Microbispora sp. H13382]|uniref:hypothetical protein n=1 Tax=Microbispora sp. H13382 TaxID=2729112 RepID=UPI001601AE03|nr:hypothetical protein [Microbispora sp. H13382]